MSPQTMMNTVKAGSLVFWYKRVFVPQYLIMSPHFDIGRLIIVSSKVLVNNVRMQEYATVFCDKSRRNNGVS
jgi:hypothetical protein